MMHLQTNILALLLLIAPVLSWALPNDSKQPINIEADHAQLDDKEGITQYKGNAILTQGTLRIEGDVITFYYDQNQQITKAVAQGKLATYKQLRKQGEPPVKARALQMEYHAKTQKIYLLGEGHVWQGGDEFSGNRIEYDIARDIVNANSAPITVNGETQKKGRVHIIIQPPGKKATAPESKPKAHTPKPAPQPANNASSSSTDSNDEDTPNNAYPTAITTTNLNVRTGPGTQYGKLGMLEQNTSVIILTRQASWVQIRGVIDDQIVIGWVSSRYLQE